MMHLSELTEEFLVRDRNTGGYVPFKAGFTRWHLRYIEQLDKYKYHIDVKSRVVGLSSFYDLIAFHKLLQPSPFECLIINPTMRMINRDRISINQSKFFSIGELAVNNKHQIKTPNGNSIVYRSEGTSRDLLHNIRPHYIFLDEIFMFDRPKYVLEQIIEYVGESSNRQLFAGGSIVNAGDMEQHVKHFNNIPLNASRKFVVKEKRFEPRDLYSLGEFDTLRMYRPDLYFELIEEDYSDKFKKL